MTLIKDKSIKDLLHKLDLCKHGWTTIDYWEADLCAIGIVNPNKPRHIVYISTFDEEAGSYYYECEIPNGPNLHNYISSRTGEHVSYEEVKTILHSHLK